MATIIGAGPGVAQSMRVGQAGLARRVRRHGDRDVRRRRRPADRRSGPDLPHHAYQAAMVQAATPVAPFARRAMHVGAVHYQARKMAKSTGNLVLVGDLLRSYPAGAIRLLLDRPWQAAWEYHDGDLDAATADLESLHAAAGRQTRSAHSAGAVTAALLDDLDIPAALAIARQDGGEAARGLLHLLALS